MSSESDAKPEVPVDEGDDDVALIRRITSGDQSALGILYDRYASLMMAVGQRILRNARETEDLLHDVFVEAWTRAGDFDPARGTVRSWLVLRMRSRCLDRVKSAGYSRARPLSDASDGARAARAEMDALSEDAHKLRGVLAELPEDQQAVLVLGYFEGLSSSEIAQVLGIPIGTVKSRVAAALSKIRSALGIVPGGG